MGGIIDGPIGYPGCLTAGIIGTLLGKIFTLDPLIIGTGPVLRFPMSMLDPVGILDPLGILEPICKLEPLGIFEPRKSPPGPTTETILPLLFTNGEAFPINPPPRIPPLRLITGGPANICDVLAILESNLTFCKEPTDPTETIEDLGF